MKKRRILSFILAMSMLIGILPIGEIMAYAEKNYEVKRIEITRNFNGPKDTGTYYIAITGKGLRNIPILYQPEGGGGKRIPLRNPDPGSNDYYVQFSINPAYAIKDIMIGSDEPYEVDETEMPIINEVEPKNFDLVGKVENITIEGNKFSKIDGKNIKTIINRKDQSNKFKSEKNTITLDKSYIKNNMTSGSQNLSFVKEVGEDVKVKTTYNYDNLFRIYESIDIDKEDINIFPNRGTVGTEVTIKTKGNTEHFSVFFLEKETDEFLYGNMGEDVRYPKVNDNNGIIKVKVPNLDSGRTYKIIVTDNVDRYVGKTTKPKTDLTKFINRQKVIGEFYIVDSGVSPEIVRIVPDKGTSAGDTNVSIHGRRFEELNSIDGLDIKNKEIKEENKKIIRGKGDSKKLQIIYDSTGATYNQKPVKTLTRDFLVTIGRDALFEEKNLKKNKFNDGDSEEDTLYVKTRTLESEALKDPVKDVIIEITTTIVDKEGEKYIFTEVVTKEKGYTFLPEYTEPEIKKVTPDKIQVKGKDSKTTKNDTLLSIEGENFNVFRYIEDLEKNSEEGQIKTNYPKVVIGGNGEHSGQIFIERREDGVYYGSPLKKDKDGNIKYKKEEGALFEVLDKNGNIVDGVGDNIVGNSIVVTIPKDIEIASGVINKALPVAVANPKRDTGEKGHYIWKDDFITFVEVFSSPIIESVNPYIVTVEGGEEITIKGRNFQEGIKVFIDGKEVPNVTRDIDKLSTKGTLKFKAPKGREGENIVQVMNPDGGSDTHEFIYIKTMNVDPRINSIAPNKGTKDTLVVIKGNNFLKPDETVTDTKGLGIYKLIGTRVFLGECDVNTYNMKDGTIKLQNYESPKVEDEKLLDIEKDRWTEKEELKLSPYYKYTDIKSNDGKTYTIYVDYEGNPVISGQKEFYTFKYVGNEKIIALDTSGQIYKVDSQPNKIILEKVEENKDKNLEFDIKFDSSLLSVGENEFENKSLRVADYYDSLILDSDGDFYIIDVDDMGTVTLSNGKNDIYEIFLNSDGKIVATKGKDSYPVVLEEGVLKIKDKTFTFKTPYSTDPDTNVIVGHRAKVKTKNEVWVSIPEKSIPGFYDVTVKNPDTKSYTVKNGFEYLIPQSQPTINYINPSQGSVEGGYEITIYGEGFEDTSEVYIAGVKIDGKDVKISPDYKSIIVKVPKYPGDIETDFITDKKFVPVVVVNEDGGSASRHDLFVYVIASSRPRINKIEPIKASAAGGEVVEIWGYDFRFFEPYKGEIPEKGDKNYEDLDRNGEWTNMKTEKDCPKKPLNHPLFDEYCDSAVLPKVFFGSEEAKIVEFSAHHDRIKVIAPRSRTLGVVDVYIVNNDAGTSNKVKFTYKGSNPQINSITPATGKKQGGENVDILGTNFKKSNIKLINKEGKEEETSIHLVRFGGITNRNIDRTSENSGRIDGGSTIVRLPGGLKVEYRTENGKQKLDITLQDSKKVYTGEYDYSEGILYIDLESLKDKKGNNYDGHELIKMEIFNGRLFVDRGYSPEVEETFRDQLEVTTPSYYTVGMVNVVVENPDEISNEIGFEYKNPDSQPKITNITRDGQDPKLGDDGKIKILSVFYKGDSIITVTGKDFREDAIIQIGDFLTINPKDIDYTLPYKMTFKMPQVDETKVGRLYKLVVINEDGGTGSSDSLKPPIYIEFIKGESKPQITEIQPDRGPTKGGTTVTITGKDFREEMEGFDGELNVYFGETKVPKKDINFIDYKTIEVVTPKGTPGRVEVKVENPDGTMSNIAYFTYISGPTIKRVEDPDINRRINQISVKGGQEIKLKGYEFMPGAKVVFMPKIRKPEKGETQNLIYIEGQPYVLEEGVDGTNYKFQDEETAFITTPQGKLGEKGILIINKDGGASPIYEDLVYELPELEAPEEVEAELVHDKYIKVHWKEVKAADYYEIYEVDSKGRDEFIGSTELTTFLYKDIEPKTKYRFLVKAVGEFGSSPPSIVSNRVKTGTHSGYEDDDGRLNERTTIEKNNDILNISLGYEDYYKETINLKNEYLGTKEIIVSIPIDLVLDDQVKDVNIKGRDFSMKFSPKDFRKNKYKKYRENSNAGIRFKISYYEGNTNLEGKTSLSNQINLEGSFFVGKEQEKIDSFARPISLGLTFNRTKADMRNIGWKDLYHYDEKYDDWIPVFDVFHIYDNTIEGKIKNLGRYTILGN